MQLKGLFFREQHLHNKKSKCAILIILIIFLLGIMVKFSLLYGNLAKLSDIKKTQLNNNTFYILVYCIPPIAFLIATENRIFSDYTTKWNTFIYSSPISAKTFIGISYLLRFIRLAAAFIISLGNTLLQCKLSDKQFDVSLIKNITIILLFIIITNCINIPITYRYKSQNAFLFFATPFYLILYIVSLFSIFKYKDNFAIKHPNLSSDEANILLFQEIRNKLSEMVDCIFTFAPFIIIAVFLLSYFISVKQFERREG